VLALITESSAFIEPIFGGLLTLCDVINNRTGMIAA
jgi:hypothetical protein